MEPVTKHIDRKVRELTEAVDQYRRAKGEEARRVALARYYKAKLRWDDARQTTP